MHLVIVESPTKAKTIKKFLGADYTVIASMGHVRDLPESSAAIPAEAKKTEWGQLGVNVDHDFEPLYVIPKKKAEVIRELKAALKKAEDVYLATDEDREGESISWHLLEVLKPKIPVHRLVFHEITKEAINRALEHPRALDEKLVRAQETRRILDRLVGYSVSPVLWKKIAYGLSAGRVQSSALRAVVERERKRIAFRSAAYWDVLATVKEKGEEFEAKLVETEEKRVAIGKDFDEQTGELTTKDAVVLDEAKAKAIATEVKELPWKVLEVNERPTTRKAPAPFTTSTLQQEANRKLGLSSRETMRIAQALYEHGHITYMRTDSVNLAEDAVTAIRKLVGSRMGEEFLPDEARHHATTAKGAQEAHEAIRPSLNFVLPDETGLSGREHDVYELIWMRALASQMKDAQMLQTSATSSVGKHRFQSTGMRIVFAGFLRAYAESSDDPEQALENREKILPTIKVGDALTCLSAEPVAHETKPPARYTEASLVQFMEKVGIGRPSTYASTISTLFDRDYVKKMGNALAPTFTGMAVTQLLEQAFPDLVDTSFTSTMENSLDQIAEGEMEWLPYLRQFFLGDKGLRERVKQQTETLDADKAKSVDIAGLDGVQVRVGRFGPYLEVTLPNTGSVVKTSVPEDMPPADLTNEKAHELATSAQQGPTSLGQDPETGKFIYLKTGSFGPYLQLGEEEEGSKKKPKRASIPKTIPLQTVDLKLALSLLSLPRLLGTHPESTKEIRAGIGRFGPYIVHDGDFRSLKGEDDVLTVTLERALEILAQPKGTRGGTVLRTIGSHPDDNQPIALVNGKYGVYVKHGKKNATVPKDLKPEDVTLEQAVEWLAAKKVSKRKKRA